MLHLLVRILIVIIIFLIIILLFKKKIISYSRKKWAIVLALLYVLFNISLLIPFEAKLLKFDSPTDAFNYVFFNNKIVKIIGYDDSAFIIYMKDDEICITYTNKNKDKWEPAAFDSFFNEKVNTRGLYVVFRVNNKQNNKQIVLVFKIDFPKNTANLNISDNINSQFTYFDVSEKTTNLYDSFYYTIIDSNVKDYTLNFDGEEINIISADN